jgi:flagellar biosynthesis protein FlhG
MSDQAAKLRELAQRTRNEGNGNRSSEKRVIAITSGKGGVGKTNLAVNLAIGLTGLGKRVMVMDADLGLANIDVILGITPKYNLYHVLKGQRNIGDIVIEGPRGVKIIAGGSGIVELANLGEEQRSRFVEAIDELEDDFDILLVDTSAGITQNVMSFLMAADEVIVITTPEPTSITDAYGIINAISKQKGRSDVKLIVNRVKSEQEGRKVAGKIKTVARQFLSIYVEDLGVIYDDASVGEAVKKRQPFILAYPRSKASGCVNELAARLVREPLKGSGEIKGFFKRVVEFLKR